MQNTTHRSSLCSVIFQFEEKRKNDDVITITTTTQFFVKGLMEIW